MNFDFQKLPYKTKKELVTSKFFVTYLLDTLCENGKNEDLIEILYALSLEQNEAETKRFFASYLTHKKSFPKQVFSDKIPSEELEKFYNFIQKQQ